MPDHDLPPRRDSLHATVMLIVTTFLWGLSFPLMKSWQEQATDCPGGEVLASATLIGVRILLGLPLLALGRPDLFWKPTRRAHQCGAAVGTAFFIGFILQVLGLTWTTPALSAFLTSLCSAWVPLLAWVWFRTKAPLLSLQGILLGLVGTAVLAEIDSGQEWTLGKGEWLTFFAALAFAVQVLLLDRFGREVPSAHMTVSFLAVTGLLAFALAGGWASANGGVGSWLQWTVSMLRVPNIALDVALMSILCTVLAFHLMNVYQPRVSASRAALIYLLEPVFASLFSIVWGYDTLTPRLLLGGGIILFGNLLVETPRLIYEWKRPA